MSNTAHSTDSTDTQPTVKIPATVRGARQGDAIEISGPEWSQPLQATVLSEPTTEMVGIFHADVLDRYDTPWMFTVSVDEQRGTVLLCGDSENVDVAFTSHAAAVGATHTAPLDAITIE